MIKGHELCQDKVLQNLYVWCFVKSEKKSARCVLMWFSWLCVLLARVLLEGCLFWLW